MDSPNYKSVRVYNATHHALKVRAAQLNMPISKLIDKLLNLHGKEAA